MAHTIRWKKCHSISVCKICGLKITWFVRHLTNAICHKRLQILQEQKSWWKVWSKCWWNRPQINNCHQIMLVNLPVDIQSTWSRQVASAYNSHWFLLQCFHLFVLYRIYFLSDKPSLLLLYFRYYVHELEFFIDSKYKILALKKVLSKNWDFDSKYKIAVLNWF